MIYDCAIIGGGIAGLSLAILLAQYGYKVILFEKNKYPFHKVCGEYVSLESYDFLKRIGLNIDFQTYPLIDETKITAQDGSFFHRKLDLGAFGISRYLLDFELSKIAKSLGVTILEETKIDSVEKNGEYFCVKAQSQEFKSILVFGSYGKYLNNFIYNQEHDHDGLVGVKYHIKTDFPSNRIELHNFEGGYCGISKIEDEKFCMCYITTAKNLKSNNNDIKKMEENILFKNPYLKKYFSEAEFLYKKPLTISQIYFGRKVTSSKDVILLGDASGTIAPLSGNGMSIAMRSAYELSQLVDLFFKNKISFEELKKLYDKKHRSLFENRVKTTIALQKLLGKVNLTNFTIKTLSYFPKITDKIITLTHGEKF